jgi:hypothetical protein
MSPTDWKSKILTCRARFLALAAAAGAASAPGCKQKLEVVEMEATTCLSVAGKVRPVGEEGVRSPRDTSFEVRRGDDTVLNGNVTVAKEGAVPVFRARQLASNMLAQTKPCILAAVERGDRTLGTLDVEYVVGADGHVTDVTVKSTGEVGEKLRDCVVDQSRALTFPVRDVANRSVTVIRWSLKKP